MILWWKAKDTLLHQWTVGGPSWRHIYGVCRTSYINWLEKFHGEELHLSLLRLLYHLMLVAIWSMLPVAKAPPPCSLSARQFPLSHSSGWSHIPNSLGFIVGHWCTAQSSSAICHSSHQNFVVPVQLSVLLCYPCPIQFLLQCQVWPFLMVRFSVFFHSAGH